MLNKVVSLYSIVCFDMSIVFKITTRVITEIYFINI